MSVYVYVSVSVSVSVSMSVSVHAFEKKNENGNARPHRYCDYVIFSLTRDVGWSRRTVKLALSSGLKQTNGKIQGKKYRGKNTGKNRLIYNFI